MDQLVGREHHMNLVGHTRVRTEEQARGGVSLGAQEDKIHAYAVVKD